MTITFLAIFGILNSVFLGYTIKELTVEKKDRYYLWVKAALYFTGALLFILQLKY